MNLATVIQLKFPGVNLRKDVIVQDDGNGEYIKEWNLPAPLPSDKDILQWKDDLKGKFQFEQNKVANQAIVAQLSNIDAKTIRALREGDTNRIKDLDTQAQRLRAQLLPTEG